MGDASGHRESDLPRTKGRLTAESFYYDADGVKWFDCSCSCGRQRRKVRSRTFDRGGIAACRRCQEEGVAPDLREHLPVRKHVTLDAVSLLTLGYDPEEVTSPQLRQMLQEIGDAVREGTSTVPFTDADWGALGAVAVTERGRGNLNSKGSPVVRLRLLNRDGVVDRGTVEGLDPLQRIAVLSALRWAGKCDRWWEVDTRVEG